ncbi:MAG: ATP phosphoribosyltransferase regulatory subunit, partial [Chitinispirillaceae bacterium]|nr:ATP phosphoribosyltransferase regulatory subunit [Chitinispirillaceae bacterium]
ICFDIGIVRGLAYYTGIVFEIFALDKNLRAIAGGGRYDNLVELYGGPSTPAVGFAAGDVVLGEILREKGLLPSSKPRCSVFIASLDDEGYQNLIQMAQEIRREGISCEFPLKATNISRQLKLADTSGAKFTVFSGGIEGKEGKIKIKNMIDGSEETIPRGEVLSYLQSRLTK